MPRREGEVDRGRRRRSRIGLHSDGRDGQNVTDHRPTPGSKQGRDAILDQNCTQQSSTAYSPYPTEQTLTKLPLKLGKEPLIEALFEMRFKATAPVSNILPGLLFTKFKGEKKIEKLPAAQLPEELRKVDPSLHYAPLLRIYWDRFMILTSDRSSGLACKMPYPGWNAAFKPRFSILRR